MIEVKNLTFSYSKRGPEVLSDVSFGLPSGNIGVLLGPNGVGKSTLFRCVLGLAKPQGGTVCIDGKDIYAMKARERAAHIAYVPQKVSFAPLSVYDAVMVGRLPYFSIAPKRKDHEAVCECLEEFGLTPLMNRNVLELSGGEQQIVAIARAYAQGASVLVFDEPTSNLDIANRALVLKQIKRLAEKGLTVLLSMHEINDALEIGDRFYFVKDKGLFAQGDASVFTSETLSSVFGVRGEIHLVNDKRIFVLGGKNDENED